MTTARAPAVVFVLAAFRLFAGGEWSAAIAAVVIAVLILLVSVWLDRRIAQRSAGT